MSLEMSFEVKLEMIEWVEVGGGFLSYLKREVEV